MLPPCLAVTWILVETPCAPRRPHDRWPLTSTWSLSLHVFQQDRLGTACFIGIIMGLGLGCWPDLTYGVFRPLLPPADQPSPNQTACKCPWVLVRIILEVNILMMMLPCGWRCVCVCLSPSNWIYKSVCATWLFTCENTQDLARYV